MHNYTIMKNICFQVPRTEFSSKKTVWAANILKIGKSAFISWIEIEIKYSEIFKFDEACLPYFNIKNYEKENAKYCLFARAVKPVLKTGLINERFFS